MAVYRYYARQIAQRGMRRDAAKTKALKPSSPHANSCRVAQVWTSSVVRGSVRNLLAVLPYLANERDSASRIVERDVVADLLQIKFGLWCEVRAHSLRAVFGHFGVLALQTI